MLLIFPHIDFILFYLSFILVYFININIYIYMQVIYINIIRYVILALAVKIS